jgi:DNA repair protein RecO (recombination protein O)
MSHVPAGAERALIVGGVDYGEADRVVHLLTGRGQLAAFAFGAKKSRRRFAGALQPFFTVRPEFELRRREGMPVLRAASIECARMGISQDLVAIGTAGYVAELAARVAPEGEASEAILALVEAVLDSLNAGVRPRPSVRRAFELMLLDELGYRPELAGCVECGAGPGFIDFARGGALCGAHRGGARPIGPKTSAWVQRVLDARSGFDPTAGLDPAWADTAAEKLGPSLDAVYRSLLDRPLRSLAVLEALLRP